MRGRTGRIFGGSATRSNEAPEGPASEETTMQCRTTRAGALTAALLATTVIAAMPAAAAGRVRSRRAGGGRQGGAADHHLRLDRQDRRDGRELHQEVRGAGDRHQGLGVEPARDDHPRGAGRQRAGRRGADHRRARRPRPAPAAEVRRELAAARHGGQDPGRVPRPAGDHHQRQCLGLQHRGLRRMPGEEPLGADDAGMEGQGRLLRPAVEADLSGLVQPDRDALRRRDGGGLRGPVRQGARPQRRERHAGLGQGLRGERPAARRTPTTRSPTPSARRARRSRSSAS